MAVAKNSELSRRRMMQASENRKTTEEALKDLALAEVLIKRGLRKLAQVRIPLGNEEDYVKRRVFRKALRKVEEVHANVRRTVRGAAADLIGNNLLSGEEISDDQT